jgi:hypothetical protein
MEITIWTFVVFVLVALFKTLKYEKNIAGYDEKQLLMLYLEIKNTNPDYRSSYVIDWEKHHDDLRSNLNSTDSQSKLIIDDSMPE